MSSASGISRPGAGSGSEAVIRMRDIVKKFKTHAGEVTVLKGINTEFYPAEFVSVVGKSGSGKSTLVNMLTGIDRPTSGEVQIGETHVNRLSESQMARWRGTNLGIVFQFYQLLPVLTLLENTMLPMDISNCYSPAERETRALDLLKRVGLEGEAHKMPAAVSGGQQQSAAIARALANDPPILVADEPTGNLDSKTAENIMQVFEGLVERGKTIIMVTHDPNLAERTTRTLLLADGEVIHPAVAQALHWLTHAQMLKATHHSAERHLAAGEPLLRAGERSEYLYIVTAGKLEARSGVSARCQVLEPGQVFGQLAVLGDAPAGANVSAPAGEPAAVLAVERATLLELAAASAALREGLLREGGLV